MKPGHASRTPVDDRLMTRLLAFRSSVLGFALCVLLMLGAGEAQAITAGSVTIRPSANCSSDASLDLSWTGAGNHYEFGAAYDAAGIVIGTFGPDASSNDNWNGQYLITLSTQQPANALIGSYAWVGSNPPTPNTAIEYFVVYNCTTRAVLYSCSGAYGTCARGVHEAIASLPGGPFVPTNSPAALVTLVLAVGAAGAVVLRRQRARS